MTGAAVLQSEWATRVEGFARDAAPRTRPFTQALVELIPPPSGGHVLDVATGTGIVAVEAASTGAVAFVAIRGRRQQRCPVAGRTKPQTWRHGTIWVSSAPS